MRENYARLQRRRSGGMANSGNSGNGGTAEQLV
jgi:hypothetical protein